MSHKWKFSAVVQGQLLTVKSAGCGLEASGRGLRGDVVGMSKASRKRLIESILRLDLEAMAKRVFITLTYHKKVTDPERIKKHLFSFWRKVIRRFGQGLSCLWRMELQQRGVEHFHLIVFGLDFMPLEWVAEAWWKSCGKQSKEHLKAGTRIEKIRTGRGVVWYVAKYVAKESQDKTLGRVWGWLGRDNVVLAPSREIEITVDQRRSLEAVFYAKVGRLAFAGQGFKLYGQGMVDAFFGDD